MFDTPRSDYGHLNVDLFAPGSDINLTVPGNEYASKSGSSMSAPVVTGVAALLRSYFPAMSASQVKEFLLSSAFRSSQLVNRPGTQEKVKFTTLSVSGRIVIAFQAVQTALARYAAPPLIR